MPYLTEAMYISLHPASYLGVVGVNANNLPESVTAASVVKKIISTHAVGHWYLTSKRIPTPPKPKGAKPAPHRVRDRGKYEVIVFFAEQADFNALCAILKGKTLVPPPGALGCFAATIP